MVSTKMRLWGLQAIFAALVSVCALVACHGTAMAQDEDTASESPADSAIEKDNGVRPLQERCIPLRRVRNVQIVDSQTIIWEVAGGPINYYKMTLTSKCPGLTSRDAFVHSSSGSRLCDVGEWIRVAGGTRAICTIDRIEPYTPPDAAAKDGQSPPDENSSSGK